MARLVRTNLNPAQVTTLPFHFGLAIARALEPWTGDALRLKWPNDLLLNGKKLGGILAESVPAHGTERGCVAILGLGLNVNTAIHEFPEDIRSLGTSLSASLTEQSPTRTEVAASILTRLSAARASLETGTIPRGDWLQRAAWLNEKVAVQQDGSRLEGVFAGIDEDGSLNLRRADGSLARVAHGDLLRRTD
jgi:BirA family biotin operon repressor/biotin-[acetyl-CoA-carboxylase] ligase